jgi:[acyl-carrier-protein] S-malonyltransferase
LADRDARALVAEWSEAADVDLLAYGTTADADAIRDTAIAQPLIVAASLLAAQALGGPPPALVAGHSVGEFAAAALAGALSPTEAVALVATRGRAMAECGTVSPGGMVAVVGGDPDTVLAAIASAGLTAANHNGAGQIVAAGPLPALAALAADPPPRCRLVRLAVAGAFHTAAMAPAEAALADAVAARPPPGHPRTQVPLASNLDGAVLTDPLAVRDRLVRQVTRPVRWDLVSRTMASLPLTSTVELAPAGVLTGLVKRGLPHLARLTLDSPDDAAPVAAALAATPPTPPPNTPPPTTPTPATPPATQ